MSELTFDDWHISEQGCMLTLIDVDKNESIKKQLDDGYGILIIKTKDGIKLRWIGSYMHNVSGIYRELYPNYRNFEFHDMTSYMLHIDKFLDRINSLIIFI